MSPPTNMPINNYMQILQRLVVVEQSILNLKNDLAEQKQVNEDLIERLDRLQNCFNNAKEDLAIHRTYQKGIRNALYTVGMIILFFMAADFKEIGKIVHDFLNK